MDKISVFTYTVHEHVIGPELSIMYVKCAAALYVLYIYILLYLLALNVRTCATKPQ